MLQRLIIMILLSITSGSDAIAQDSQILSKTAHLQKLAVRAQVRCGVANCTAIYPDGKKKKIRTGADFRVVFGKEVKVEDIRRILAARASETASMEGQFDELLYMCLNFSGVAGDNSFPPVVKRLMTDKSELVRGWAVIALLTMANRDPAMLEDIKKYQFPQNAIDAAKARATKIPNWVKISK